MQIETSNASEVTRVAERAKPELVTIGNRQIISSGRWNDCLVAEYIMLNGKDRWLSVGELAKVAWGHNSLSTKARARTRLWRILKHILVNHGKLIVIEYDPAHYNRGNAVKMYDPRSEQERQYMAARFDKMAKRREMSVELYELAIDALTAPEVNN